MKIIGITGGIGAGKSTVLSILKQEYDAHVIEADKVAHDLMKPNQPAYRRIVEAFSDAILDETGEIDRAKLSTMVFHNEERLEQLNSIVHPEVKDYIQAEIRHYRQMGNTAYFVIEAALLIEDGYTSICDELWYIYAPDELRIKRLMESRGYSREKCDTIMRNQSSDAFYRKHSDYFIENGNDLENTKKQIDELLKKH